MSDIEFKSLAGDTLALSQETVDALRASIRGEVLQPGDAGSDAARAVWNGMIDRRPALIARCTGTADVLQAVNFAAEHELLTSVRGGGHNAAGYATNDGGLVIDLSLMKGVYVDAQARTARAEGGVTWGDLDRETQVFGLAAPGGVVSTTGIAGLTLGGGHGWLRRKYGLSCDNLIAAEVVTADGRVLHASETDNADLFWAMRGGGGNFGVVTSFEFKLHPVGPMVFGGAIFYSLEDAQQVLSGWRNFMATAPDEISSNCFFFSVAPDPAFPEALHLRPIVGVSGMYSGTAEQGQRALQPLRELAEPLVDLFQPLPFTYMQAMFDPFFPSGVLQYYWKSLNLAELSDDAIKTLIAFARTRPSWMDMIDIWAMGGSYGRVGPTETAFGDRSAPFALVLNSTWADPADSSANIAWTRELFDAMRPFSDGSTYLNFPGLGEDGAAVVQDAYGANYARLVEIKRKYDPQNLFRLNQNIR